MRASGARAAALETVTRVRERTAFAHETLDAVLTQSALEPREAALATRIAYGTVATRGTLDAAIARYLRDDVSLEPRVADALAVTAYQLLFMRIPAHAAVSEGVNLVRSQRPAAAGLANAVLRRLAGEASDFPWGDPGEDVAALARLHGHPEWLARLWVDELGREDAERVMAANNEPAPLFLAHLVTRSTLPQLMAQLEDDGVDPSACPLPGCIVAGEAASARRCRPLAAGEVLVMDAGAQLAVHALRPQAGDTIIEIGAGRGSKTLLAASLAREAGGRARVLAVDVHGFKLAALATAAAKAGFDEITTVEADLSSPTDHLELPDATADSVLVDAPCSGLGTLRRHPDRRWKAEPQEIETLAQLGSLLLAHSARLVRPGGFVVYSTCTLAREENEGAIEGFLDSEAGRDFVIDPVSDEIPEVWRRFVGTEGWFRSLPSVGGPDGHFVARLKRAERVR